jgi:hypothetical protein
MLQRRGTAAGDRQQSTRRQHPLFFSCPRFKQAKRDARIPMLNRPSLEEVPAVPLVCLSGRASSQLAMAIQLVMATQTARFLLVMGDKTGDRALRRRAHAK